mgnify:CR=1 FL=1
MDNLLRFLFILTVIVSVITLMCASCYKERFENKSENTYNNYNSFVYKNKNLTNIVNEFSTLIYNPNNKLNNVTETYIETEHNLETTLKLEIQKVITNLFKNINTTHNTDYKLLNIERVKVEKNILNDEQVSVIFLLLENGKFSSRKLLLQYRKNTKNEKKTINYVRTLHDSMDLNYIRPYDFINTSNNTIKDDLIVDEKLELLKEVNEGKYKCRHGVTMNFASESKDQVLNLSENCAITNSPKYLTDPFVNPTQFVIP